MKTCKRCDQVKPLQEFYDRDNSCKGCRRKLAREYRAENIERYRAYDRARGQDEKRKVENKRQYRKRISTPEGRTREWELKKKYSNSNRRAANIIAGNAIRGGNLIRKPCEWCGSKEHIHAHHEDYTKPLDVTWLCRPCHGKRHREINEERRKSNDQHT